MASQTSIGYDTTASEKGSANLPEVVNSRATHAVGVAAAATAALLKTGSGRLCNILVTTAGSAALIFYDSIDGTGSPLEIGLVPASATANGIPFVVDMPFTHGLWCASTTGTPAVTVGYC